MNYWYKQLTLLLAAISFWIEPSFADTKDLATEAVACHQIDAAYQEVYSFEIENYYINVCQLDNNFYYHRQSKIDPTSSIFVPAKAVFRGSVFQATVDKVDYFVGLDSDRHYSSVMLNSNEVVFEPEIESRPQVAEVSDSGLQNASLDLDNPPDIGQTLICAREKSAFHPELDGWQKLIGRTIDSANKFATNNGHNFDYDRTEDPSLASIATQSGTTVNLQIVPTSETVERVCISSDR